jgi:hypothetical protein
MKLPDQENSVHDELFSIAENNDSENAPFNGKIQEEKVDSETIAVSEAAVIKKTSAKGKSRKKSSNPDDENPSEKELETLSEIPVHGETEESEVEMVSEKIFHVEKNTDIEYKEHRPSEIHTEIINYSLLGKEELVKTLEELLQSKPVQEIRRDVEAIKVNFYKKHRAELEQKRKKFIEDGGLSEEFEVPVENLEAKAAELLRKYRDLRMEYNRHQDDAKVDNLRMRHEIIEEIKELINSEESINKTFHEFRDLQNRWREIGAIPQQNINDIWETYHHHIEKFYDYIKINKELRDLDLKKNFELKIQVCEKAEKLLLEPNVLIAFNSLQEYHARWREIGPVPKEKKTEVWERFKEVTSKINKKHQNFYQELKETQKRNFDSKIILIEKAEELSVEVLENHKDWTRRTDEILELQKAWKTIGFAPKKDNNRIYNRFRAACDKFFERKRSFYTQNQEVQGSNLQAKLELCMQAEAMQESTDWKKTTDAYIRIQRKWKETGPAPRKQSEQVWKRFRNACDKFFSRKTQYFSTIDETFAKNLEAKESLIKEIENFSKSGNSNSDLEKLQDFQRKWTEIGFVPFDKKDALQQRYRDAVNKQFDLLDLDENKKSLLKFRNRIEGLVQKTNPETKIRFEREKYMIKLQQLKTDIGVWENNIGFFANTSSAEAMVKDFGIKIKEAKDTIRLLEEKITIIDELNID